MNRYKLYRNFYDDYGNHVEEYLNSLELPKDVNSLLAQLRYYNGDDCNIKICLGNNIIVSVGVVVYVYRYCGEGDL